MTSEDTWDPSILDHDLEQDDQWFDSITEDNDYPSDQRYDEFGDYKRRVNISSCSTTTLENSIDTCVLYHTNNHLLRDIDDTNTKDIEDFLISMILMKIILIYNHHPTQYLKENLIFRTSSG